MNKTKMIFTIKSNVYGRNLYAPQCDISKAICRVAKRKSLTEIQLGYLRELFDIEVMSLDLFEYKQLEESRS